jgi:hypothetical protein
LFIGVQVQEENGPRKVLCMSAAAAESAALTGFMKIVLLAATSTAVLAAVTIAALCIVRVVCDSNHSRCVSRGSCCISTYCRSVAHC